METQDRWTVAEYLGPECRSKILPVVIVALAAMLKRVKPLVVFRVAKASADCKKAMKKHDLITQLLEDHGYMMRESGADPFNRPFWLMTKPR
jgi:hypothetical protein